MLSKRLELQLKAALALDWNTVSNFCNFLLENNPGIVKSIIRLFE